MDNKLLLRYIIGKANSRECRNVLEWLEESQENIDEFASMKAQYVFSSFPNRVIPVKKRNMSPVWVTAALCAPLLAATVWLYLSRQSAVRDCEDARMRTELILSQKEGTVTYVANAGIKSSVVLPDSSVVVLNGGSKLVAPQCFDSEIRDLFISGEGYFKVKHNEDWPMHIHTSKDVTVKVLGTTFDLSAYEDDANVKLTLIEGKVIMREERINCEHEIKPNQEISISDSKGRLRRELPDIRIADVRKNTAWVSGELIFDNTPMPEIIKKLERWYGVNVHIVDPDILNYRLTATFTTESITRVLDLIRFSSMLDYEINGQDVYIRHMMI